VVGLKKWAIKPIPGLAVEHFRLAGLHFGLAGKTILKSTLNYKVNESL
jgi:hypothetical protein